MLFFILERNDYNFNMKRKGQALIIVVIIFALIVSVFAISISTAMRSHALEETEIYQREQSLYLAQMGINQMIYNINDGETYRQPISDASPSGIGTYVATYYTPDTSSYDGNAYIKGEGTVGQYTRVVYASLQGSTEEFKYCLFTSTGGRDGVNSDSNFTNSVYGVDPIAKKYAYNTSAATIPTPDMSWYTDPPNYEKYHEYSSNTTYNPTTYNDTGKVVFINYTGSDSSDTLTITFTSSPISLSLITNFPNIATNIDGTWDSVSWNGLTYPILVHQIAYSNMQFNVNLKGNKTLTLNGFVYTNATFTASYSAHSFLTINGEMVTNSLENIADKIKFNYINDYFNNPPPHFIYTPSGAGVKFLPSSFREEY
jgi:hypothetical protein